MRHTKITLSYKLLPGIAILMTSCWFIIENLHFYTLEKSALGKYHDVKWVLISHIFGGAMALLTGPFALWENFRNRFLQLHRLLGKIYIGAILLSALSALHLTFTTARQINIQYVFALQMLIFPWLASTSIAYWAVRQRKIQLHQEWMTRSYICTVAFVGQVLILRLPFVAASGSFAEISPTIFWFSWSIPLFIFQLYLALKKINL